MNEELLERNALFGVAFEETQKQVAQLVGSGRWNGGFQLVIALVELLQCL